MRPPMLSAHCASASKSTWAVRSASPGARARLQCTPQAVFDVTVVEDQRGAVRAHPPAKLERDPVGAPFENRAFGRLPQVARQAGLEVEERLARQAETKVAVSADVADTLVPAV